MSTIAKSIFIVFIKNFITCRILEQPILFEVMIHGFTVVVFESDGYGGEVTIGYEGVEFYVGYLFKHIFAF